MAWISLFNNIHKFTHVWWYNLSSQEANVGEPQVQGNPRIYSNTVSQKKKSYKLKKSKIHHQEFIEN